MNVGDDDTVEPRPSGPPADPSAAPATPSPGEAPADAAGPVDTVPDADVVQLRDDVVSARRELEQTQARLRAVSKAYTDLQAEMKAFKERMENRARQDSELQAFDQVRAFFDPVMNLKRSLAAAGSDPGALVQGLQMVQAQFMEALSKLGLSEVPGVGAPFDPRVHEALGVQPVSDREQDGKVLVVHTAGYLVNGRVLQAAQVVIGQYAEPAGEA
jgi:molecular chaperone GrpE